MGKTKVVCVTTMATQAVNAVGIANHNQDLLDATLRVHVTTRPLALRCVKQFRGLADSAKVHQGTGRYQAYALCLLVFSKVSTSVLFINPVPSSS